MTEAPIVRFLYVGQIRREKGLDHIVDAARSLLARSHRFHVSIAGPTDFWARDMFAPNLLKEVQADASLSSAISFLGSIEDVDGAFKAHDIHLAPSIVEESYGLVVVEAKKNARPSIIYPSGGMIELVQHRYGGWVCEKKAHECLVEAMRFFLEDPQKIPEMGRNAAASLASLGLVREQFENRWADVVAHTLKCGRKHEKSR